METSWVNALKCEQEVAKIIAQQETNGVQFDKSNAENFQQQLDEEMRVLYDEVRPNLRYNVLRPYKTVCRAFTNSGDLTKNACKYYKTDKEQLCIGGNFSRVTFEEPLLSKKEKLIQQLLWLGWKPSKDERTEPSNRHPEGSPKLSIKGEPVQSLVDLEGVGKPLAQWYIRHHRIGVIEGWLRQPRLEVDGRIPARANSLGTPTFRMTHNIVCNVPKAEEGVYFGKQMRSLFITRPGYKLVGYDAAGLEARVMAHYLGDPVVVDLMCNPDPDWDFHSEIWQCLDEWITSRSNSKNVGYALIYGARDLKLGTMCDKNGASRPKKQEAIGAMMRASIRDRFPEFVEAAELFNTKVKSSAKRGYLIGLDGRKVTMRRDPISGKIQIWKSGNTLFQSAGAVIMKYSLLFLTKWAKHIDYLKVIDMHDEGQNEVISHQADEFGELAVRSIVQSGKYLNLKAPLDGEYKVGENWSQTH